MSPGGAVERAMQPGPDAVEPPATEVPPDRPRGREIARQQAPLGTGAQQMEDRVDNGTQVRAARPAARPWWRKVWRDQRPLGIGQIGRTGVRHAWQAGPEKPLARQEARTERRGSTRSRSHRTPPLWPAPPLSRRRNQFILGARMVADPTDEADVVGQVGQADHAEQTVTASDQELALPAGGDLLKDLL